MGIGIIIGIIIAVLIALYFSGAGSILTNYISPNPANSTNSTSSAPNPIAQPISTITTWGGQTTTFPQSTIPNWILLIMVIIVLWFVFKR